jgi:hypothetical protein
MTPTRVLLGTALAVVLAIGLVIVVANVIREEDPETLGTLGMLRAPRSGEVRPDYLADGTPVWVVGHDDGTVDVVSGVSTHQPFNILKALMWCDDADAFVEPDAASEWDEFGFWIDGPALSGLPRYAVQLDGMQVVVGPLGIPPSTDEPHSGPPPHRRERCLRPDEAGVTYHTFDGWQAWDSPTAAVAAAPDGWILLEAHLAVADEAVIVCGVSGCQDSVEAAAVELPDPDMEFSPLYGERFIARVSDGELLDLTRLIPLREDLPP